MAVDRAAVAAWVARTCAEQGVPERICDPAVLSKVCVVLASGMARGRAQGASAPRTPRVAPAPTPAT